MEGEKQIVLTKIYELKEIAEKLANTRVKGEDSCYHVVVAQSVITNFMIALRKKILEIVIIEVDDPAINCALLNEITFIQSSTLGHLITGEYRGLSSMFERAIGGLGGFGRRVSDQDVQKYGSLYLEDL
jgi:hypothetical protein